LQALIAYFGIYIALPVWHNIFIIDFRFPAAEFPAKLGFSAAQAQKTGFLEAPNSLFFRFALSFK
jgi:hypothetical protein